jgi:ATP-dependent Clp protease ATP-binding subunit ClpA
VGAMFSCANVIFVFTMNLPGGMDEQLHKGIGFTYTRSRSDMKRRVASEIKAMLSGAFLSRVGTPIVFDPLDGKSLSVILERAIRAAALSAAERLGRSVTDIVLQDGTGEKVLNLLETSLLSFGARALLEHGRSLAAGAVLRWVRSGRPERDKMIISADSDGELNVLD